MKGVVTKSTGSWYRIKTENAAYLDARIKGKIRLRDLDITNPVAVGDRVIFELEKSGDTEIGVIKDIEPRHNYIIRKSNKLSKQSQIIAANVDLALLVVTLVNPTTSLGFIDRFLVMASAFHIPVTLVFNKCDLYGEHEQAYFEHLKNIYEPLGFDCVLCSNMDIEYSPSKQLESLIRNKTVLISGHSGVGKSTILNALIPEAMQKVELISNVHLKGKHTTTFAEMFYIDESTSIIDTPGIRDFGIIDIEPAETGQYFPEIRAFMGDCRFNNCTHTHEPGCAVVQAYEDGYISAERFNSYLSILENHNIFD